MKIYKSKSGATAAMIYLLLIMVLLALPYLMQSAEAGMFVFSFTLPWSLLIGSAAMRFPGAAWVNSETAGIAIYTISGLINAALIYAFFAWATKNKSNYSGSS